MSDNVIKINKLLIVMKGSLGRGFYSILFVEGKNGAIIYITFLVTGLLESLLQAIYMS